MFDFIDMSGPAPPGMPVREGGAVKFAPGSYFDRRTGDELRRTGTVDDQLTVTHHPITNRVSVKGSLHKYQTGGSNAGDFQYRDVPAVIERLSNDLGIDPATMIVHALEFGVNASPPPDCDAGELLRRLHMYAGPGGLISFTQMTGRDARKHGKAAIYSKYRIKMYDKGAQEGLGRPLLRFELHTEGRYLRDRLNVPVKTLTDLTNPTVWNGCARLLTDVLKNIVWCEPIDNTELSRSDEVFVAKAGRPEYWQTLGSSTRARHLSKYRRLCRDHRPNIFTGQFSDAVRAKVRELSEVPRPSIQLPVGRINPTLTFAGAIARYLNGAHTLTDIQLTRLAAGRCIICNDPLPARRRPDMQTCPRSVKQCRNVKSNQYQNRLKPLRHDYHLAAAGQGRLFALTEGLRPL